MSSLIVEVAEIAKIDEHKNADALEIAEIKGWRVIVQKDRYSPGDKVVYFPVDTVLPVETSDEMGVTKYLSKGRIRAAKLRGVISCGLVADCRDVSWEVGRNVADEYGATKWEPPEFHSQGFFESEHPSFYRYTDIENIRNFPDVLREGEEVVITEKLHGTSDRAGKVGGKLMAGSHNRRRKYPELGNFKESLYWLPFADPNFHKLIDSFDADVIVYSEIYGDGVQDLKYGLERGSKHYAVFDIMVDGKYLDYLQQLTCCNEFSIPIVPVLYVGGWKNELMYHARGESCIAPGQLREGAVIRPVEERWSDQTGRVIMKCISEEYLTRKGGSERH